jgi:hypothetical protein
VPRSTRAPTLTYKRQEPAARDPIIRVLKRPDARVAEATRERVSIPSYRGPRPRRQLPRHLRSHPEVVEESKSGSRHCRSRNRSRNRRRHSHSFVRSSRAARPLNKTGATTSWSAGSLDDSPSNPCAGQYSRKRRQLALEPRTESSSRLAGQAVKGQEPQVARDSEEAARSVARSGTRSATRGGWRREKGPARSRRLSQQSHVSTDSGHTHRDVVRSPGPAVHPASPGNNGAKMSSSQNRRQFMQPWPLCLVSFGKSKVSRSSTNSRVRPLPRPPATHTHTHAHAYKRARSPAPPPPIRPPRRESSQPPDHGHVAGLPGPKAQVWQCSVAPIVGAVWGNRDRESFLVPWTPTGPRDSRRAAAAAVAEKIAVATSGKFVKSSRSLVVGLSRLLEPPTPRVTCAAHPIRRSLRRLLESSTRFHYPGLLSGAYASSRSSPPPLLSARYTPLAISAPLPRRPQLVPCPPTSSSLFSFYLRPSLR